MAMPGSFLHTLVVYTVVGGSLAYGLSRVVNTCFKFARPTAQIHLAFVTLAIPLMAYYFHAFLSPLLRLEHGARFYDPANKLFAWFCSLGVLGSTYYLPLLLLLLLGIYRQVTYYLHRRSIGKQTINCASSLYFRPQEILAALVEKAQGHPPILRIITKNDHSCFTYGLVRPTVVISAGLLEELSDEELQAVLAHELAHIQHRDALKNWLAVMLRDLSGYMPTSHWALRWLQNQQELAADDLAVQLTGKPLIYAATLLKVWRKSKGQPAANFNFAPALVRPLGVSHRVERLLSQEPHQPLGLIFLPALIIGVTVVAVLAYVC